MTPGADGPSQLGVQTFYRICCVNNSPDIVRKGKERNDLRPVPPPGSSDRRIFLSPKAFGKVFKGGGAGIGVETVRNSVRGPRS